MRLVLPLLATLLVAGCATKYQPSAASGGFTETRLSENTWRVSFRGNAATRSDRTDDLALLRAADLAVQNGYRFIRVQNARTNTSTVNWSMPAYTTVQGTAKTSGNRTSFQANALTIGGDDSDEIVTSTLLVAAYKAKPDAEEVYDARFLCDSIGKKYEVKCREAQ
jgi:hypothetical protein